MTTQAEAFVRAYLGPAADCPPSEAVRARMRECLLADGIPNDPYAGQQSSPMAVPGTWVWAYALYHKFITAEEAEPHFALYCKQNLEWRGLGSGVTPPSLNPPPGAPSQATVVDMGHVTATQSWLIGSLASNGDTRKLARAQALDLRALILSHKVCDAKDMSVINPRENGWPWQALMVDWLASRDPSVKAGMDAIHARILGLSGETNGVPFFTQNTHSLTDPRHGNLPCCEWMQLTILRGRAWMAQAGALGTNLILLGLKIAAHGQLPDGRMVDDYGWDGSGHPAFYDDGKETMDSWCDPPVFAAVRALNGDVPSWVQPFLALRKERFMALNRWKPNDSGFRDQKNMGLAIDYAAFGWGWRG